MKKFLKYFIIILVVLLLLLFIWIKFVVNEPRPSAVEGDAASKVEQLFTAVDKPAWDSLEYIKWTFAGAHHFVWDKEKNEALIQWDDYVVHLDPDEVTGRAYKGDIELDEDKKKKAISEAWSHWCNDMFWLAAPFKVRDPGTSISLAKDDEGKEGLLVTYESGGVTPGDSYLWFLDDTGQPTGYKMWVSIIPVGGVYFSWSDWKTMKGGAKIATNHEGLLNIPITNLEAGSSWSDLGFNESPIKL